MNFYKNIYLLLLGLCFLTNCQEAKKDSSIMEEKLKIDPQLNYQPFNADREVDYIQLSRSQYWDRLQGFWLGQCIANWTGLITEMDKIGDIGAIKTGAFYTRADWGAPDQPNIWSEGTPSNISPTIDFVLLGPDSIWGADDDTDIEYIYQHLLYNNQTSKLSPDQIRDGWLTHIKKEEENFLWVSNQKAFDLMQEGIRPPNTSKPELNEHYEMIDAQLTTEIFGLFAPTNPAFALEIARLPIRTTARENAAWIAEFYVVMHALASEPTDQFVRKEQLFTMAQKARTRLPDKSYSAKMYDFVWQLYQAKIPWEEARDSIYQRYQVDGADDYDITDREMYCNGCFAAGINFAASLVSLFYGEGDLKETIKIGTLAGWDSDNPTATWGGLIGFMMGRKAIEESFGQQLSNRFNIHRTRQGFPNDGIDTFEEMAQKGIWIVDRIVQEELKGGVDLEKGLWYIPESKQKITPATD